MGRGKRRRVASVALVVLVGGLAVAASVYAGSVVATPISSDPYQNPESQHRTQLEPDSFGWGNTVVATFQTGRFFDGGSSNIGWATTTNAGRTWTTGMLPATTIYATPAGPWARISDPAVAYDPLHDVWMISTLAIDDTVSGAAVLTSRSTDGGLTWENPVTTSLPSGTFYDKNWITCDTWPQSPYYGNCYQEWDDSTGSYDEHVDRRRADLGAAEDPRERSGIGGQPVVQPDGTVVVPYEGGAGIRAFRSEDGGNTWLSPSRSRTSVSTPWPATCARRRSHRPRSPGTARSTSPGRTAVSAAGAPRTTSSTDLDGRRGVDGQGADPDRPDQQRRRPLHPGHRGRQARRRATPRTSRSATTTTRSPSASSTCQLTVGFVSSTDGGATWTQPRKVAGPVSLTWIASTNQGVMVGDYMSTSFAGGNFAFPIFAVAKAKTGTTFDERMYSARFDVTHPPTAPLVRARKDPIRYSKHNFVPDLELPPVK